MATFNVVGIDEAIRQMELAADVMKQRAPDAVKAGAQVLKDALTKSAPAGKTGQLAASIKIDDLHHTVADGFYTDVYPDGKRTDGERNATVGYVLEYGRSNMPARPWMRTTAERCAEDVQNAMVSVLAGDGA